MEAKDLVTLGAAVIAAIASTFALLTNVRAQRRTELRLAHRKTLEEFITPLGAVLHEVVAISATVSKTRSEKSLANWKGKGQRAKATLNELRPKLRYPLWGLDEGIRVLIRLPDWALHVREDPARTKQLVEKATQLRRHLDYAIQRSYREGRPPLLVERLFVSWRAAQCREVFESGRVQDVEYERDLAELFGRDASISTEVGEEAIAMLNAEASIPQPSFGSATPNEALKLTKRPSPPTA